MPIHTYMRGGISARVYGKFTKHWKLGTPLTPDFAETLELNIVGLAKRFPSFEVNTKTESIDLTFGAQFMHFDFPKPKLMLLSKG